MAGKFAVKSESIDGSDVKKFDTLAEAGKYLKEHFEYLSSGCIANDFGYFTPVGFELKDVGKYVYDDDGYPNFEFYKWAGGTLVETEGKFVVVLEADFDECSQSLVHDAKDTEADAIASALEVAATLSSCECATVKFGGVLVGYVCEGKWVPAGKKEEPVVSDSSDEEVCF